MTRLVTNGRDAQEMLASDRFNHLITDWQMPGLDGMELTKWARENCSHESHLHITMMTAHEDGKAIGAALAAGVDDFLLKPIDPIHVQLALATARRNGRLHGRLQRRAKLLAAAHRRARAALDLVRADIAAAAELHRRLLPAAGVVNGLDVASLHHPASILGGDSIGIMPIGESRVLFFMIDVRGHGVPAALDSFHLHHRLNDARPSSPEALSQAIVSMNREIGDRGDDSYATLIAGLVEPATQRGWIVRAGHPPALICDQSGMVVAGTDAGGGFPLGWFADAEYFAEPFALAPGSRLLIMSDGLGECLDGDTSPAEISPTLERLGLAGCNQPLATFVETVDAALIASRPVTGFEDDVSLMVVACCDETP